MNHFLTRQKRHFMERNGTNSFEFLSLTEDNPLLRAGLKMSHLRMLVTIEEHGQVSAAAAALNMTQPAASRMLSEMEAIVKSPLCQRASRGVVLTQFGEALAKRAKKILLELREASRELAQMKSRQRRIGLYRLRHRAGDQSGGTRASQGDGHLPRHRGQCAGRDQQHSGPRTARCPP